MMKKFLAMVAIFAMVFPCVFAYAAEPNVSKTSDDIVPYHIYTITSQNGRSVEDELTGDERIDYMNEHGQVPGSQFLVGNKKYEVTEDYELHYLGIDETVKIDNITDITRGTSIPTRKGTLPNSGTYKMSNYIYSNRYFNLGNSGGLNESIGVTISADQEQDIMVSWMDGRNDESMEIIHIILIVQTKLQNMTGLILDKISILSLPIKWVLKQYLDLMKFLWIDK